MSQGLGQMVNKDGQFQTTPALSPTKTGHDLSKQITGTGKMGLLYPIYFKNLIPGDRLTIRTELLIKFMPMVAPLMHEIEAYVEYFKVPYRLLWRTWPDAQTNNMTDNAWESYITGAVDGTEIGQLNRLLGLSGNAVIKLPDIQTQKWFPLEARDEQGNNILDTGGNQTPCADIGFIWEALGLPYKAQITGIPSTRNQPLKWPKNAYNMIYNDWYRDENIQVKRHLECDLLAYRNYRRDYFTSANYSQQKGSAPTLPMTLSGILPVTTAIAPVRGYFDLTTPTGQLKLTQDFTTGQPLSVYNSNPQVPTGQSVDVGAQVTGQRVDLASSVVNSGINVADLRTIVALQRVLENSIDYGNRYPEYVKGFFDVESSDARLQRAEYIGRDVITVMQREVLQTAQGTGNGGVGQMYGHGQGQGGGEPHKLYAEEHCIVIGIMSVIPRLQYQNGMPRELMQNQKEDNYVPQFAFLSKQPIANSEIYYSGNDSVDEDIWAYQDIWDFMRTDNHVVTGLMRANVPQNIAQWNLARFFTQLPAYNEGFIQASNIRDDIFQFLTQPQFAFTAGITVHAMRPIPAEGEPGLLDHVYGENQGNRVPAQGRRL